MSAPRTTSASRRIRELVVVAIVALAAVLTALPTGGAYASPARADATVITVGAPSSGITFPDTAGAPDVLVQAGAPFSLVVTLVDDDGVASPVSRTQATELRVTVEAGAATFASAPPTATVPAGQSTAVFSDLVLSPAANAVSLLVEAVHGSRKALALTAGTSAAFDVVTSFSSVPVPDAQKDDSLTVSRDGVGVPCEATAEVQTCTDLVLPQGVGSDVFFSTGACDGGAGCPQDRKLLQVLAEFEDDEPGDEYGATTPATVIYKCDKTLCGGGGVPTKQLLVSLLPSGPLEVSPACSTKGVVDDVELGHCVDYVQSKRDGAGDLHLYLLLVRDARMSS